MTTQDNAISTIVDGTVNAFILEISANYPELANVMKVVASLFLCKTQLINIKQQLKIKQQ